MAQDFLNLALYRVERDGKPVPQATDLKEVKAEKNDIVTLIYGDTYWYHRLNESKLSGYDLFA